MLKNVLASLSFFTRIPFWRLAEIPSSCYSRVVEYWPLTGWLTGGLTALAVWLLMHCLPVVPAVIIAYAVRLILTGALHEDGLADFIDGMGGGRGRERILEIMKDSHIGSYGVIGLICYFLLLVSLVTSLPGHLIPWIVLAADPWGKFCGELVITLPYARNAEQAKNKTVYKSIPLHILIVGAIVGLLPSMLLPAVYTASLALPLIVSAGMICMMRRRIGGYTGDCCGAVFLCCELAFVLSSVIISRLSQASLWSI